MPIGGCGDGLQGIRLTNSDGQVLSTHPVQGGFVDLPDTAIGCGLEVDDDGCIVQRPFKFKTGAILPADAPTATGSGPNVAAGSVVPADTMVVVDWCGETACSFSTKDAGCKPICSDARGSSGATLSGVVPIGGTVPLGCLTIEADCAGSVPINGGFQYAATVRDGTGGILISPFVNGQPVGPPARILIGLESGDRKYAVIAGCVEVDAGTNQLCVELRVVGNTNLDPQTRIEIGWWGFNASSCGSCA